MSILLRTVLEHNSVNVVLLILFCCNTFFPFPHYAVFAGRMRTKWKIQKVSRFKWVTFGDLTLETQAVAKISPYFHFLVLSKGCKIHCAKRVDTKFMTWQRKRFLFFHSSATKKESKRDTSPLSIVEKFSMKALPAFSFYRICKVRIVSIRESLFFFFSPPSTCQPNSCRSFLIHWKPK